MRRKKHWLTKIREAHNGPKELRLSAGDAAQLWRVLSAYGVDNERIADDVSAWDFTHQPGSLAKNQPHDPQP